MIRFQMQAQPRTVGEELSRRDAGPFLVCTSILVFLSLHEYISCVVKWSASRSGIYRYLE